MSISDRFSFLAIKNSLPITVSLEVTRRCPNRCIHCYLEETHLGKVKRKEIDLLEIKEILSSLQNLGVVFLEITGGEPLLRDDIVDILKLAVEKRFVVRLFSSLSIKCDRILTDLKRLGVCYIDVSLYGKRETHNRITQRESFDMTIENIKKAKELGFDITVKTPVMNINIDELQWISDFAKRNRLRFKIDPIITPINNGNKKTLRYSIKSSDFKFLLKQDYIKVNFSKYERDNMVYFPCGAMRSIFAINSYGDVYPCLCYPYIVGNVRKEKLEVIFNSKKSKEIRKILEKEPEKCRNCFYRTLCVRCPGISYVYSRKPVFVYNYACKFSKSIKEFF